MSRRDGKEWKLVTGLLRHKKLFKKCDAILINASLRPYKGHVSHQGGGDKQS